MPTMRREHDSMGDIDVPADALYGAQTQRAINNFTISRRGMPEAFIAALLQIKAAAAEANVELGGLPAEIGAAISAAADALLAEPQFSRHFPVDIFQTGSGTSTNMNANEVLATLAGRRVADTVSANDHVNCSQSSNDVIPTAIHVSATLQLCNNLLPALRHLLDSIRSKQQAVGDCIKTGRTHLMDAMPMKMSQAIGAWGGALERNIAALEAVLPQLARVAQGGTAVGTGINSHPRFAEVFCVRLSARTGESFAPATDFFSQLSHQDVAVSLSGQLKSLAVTLMKIANDLRWMNSGPLAGLGEIELEALQPGSSIMPGKVNPVIPEAVAMVSAQVIGNDAAITVAGQSGNFELNVMLPLIAERLLDSIMLLANAGRSLADRAVASFTVNEENLKRTLDRNPVLATALNPVVGYMKAAEIAKRAYAEGRTVLEVAAEMTDISDSELRKLLNPEHLTQPTQD